MIGLNGHILPEGDNMLNKVMLIGRLGKDPELRYSQGGMPIGNLNVATDENYTDRDGNRVEKTEWHRVVVFDRLAENCNNYLAKGSLVYVEGSLQTRKWQDQQGQDRYTTEIRARTVRFLDKKGDRLTSQSGEDSYNEAKYSRPRQDSRPPRNSPQRQPEAEDLGPAFPSEASGMDDVPF